MSSSLDTSLFISRPIRNIERGAYVAFIHSESSIPLAKQVVGLPGDRITTDGNEILINGIAYGIIKEKSLSGYQMTPITPGIIPNGFVFVYGSHQESFDSRYKEFGLVKISAIKERLWPIF